MQHSFTFAVGVTEFDLVLPALDDQETEGTERVNVQVLAGADHLPADPDFAELKVTDNDLATVTVTSSGAPSEFGIGGTFTFTRGGGNLAAPLTVSIGVGGGASEGTDYQPLPRTVTFVSGQTSATVALTPIDDALLESDKDVTVWVADGTMFAAGTTSDDEPASVPTITPRSGSAASLVISDDEQTGNIAGVVWEDANQNGTQDASEGFAGIPVALIRSDEGVIGRAVTDGAGAYQFAGLKGGTYQVSFSAPVGTTLTLQSPARASVTVDAATGRSTPFTIGNGGPSSVTVSVTRIDTAPPPTPLARGVLIKDKMGRTLNSSGELHVAKLWYSFEPISVGNGLYDPRLRVPPAGGGSDFIDVNDDLFYVWVYDPAAYAANTPRLTTRLSTANATGYGEWNDAASDVPVVKTTQSGWYRSDSQLLVSNKIDDEYQNGQVGADEAGIGANPRFNLKDGMSFPVSDRTHRVALGGTVRVDYAYVPNGVATASVPVPAKKVIRLNVVDMTVTGKMGPTPTHPLSEVNSDIARAREIYAQVGIRIDLVAAPRVANPPQDVDLRNGFAGPATPSPTGLNTLSPQAVKLFDDQTLRATNPDGVIQVYYVNQLSFSLAGVRGITYQKASVTPEFRKYDPSIVIGDEYAVKPNGTRVKKYYVLAHEIGHALELRPPYGGAGIPIDHFPYGSVPSLPMRSMTPLNLMAPGSESSQGAEQLVTDQVRLTQEQQDRMRSTRADLVKDPIP